MNKKNNSLLLGAMAMMSAQNAYINAYNDLIDLDRQYQSDSRVKSKLTKKQIKARAKSKASRKARKK